MDYATIAEERLTSRLQKDSLKAFVRAMVGPFQNVESICNDFLSDRWIDTAIGKQLDGCGDIVGELRQGRSDDEYRLAIRLKVKVITSNGTPDDLINALKDITEPTDCQYLKGNNATVYLFTNGIYSPQSIIEPFNAMAPAGIERVSIAKTYTSNPMRMGGLESPTVFDVFDNADNQLTSNGSDLQVQVEQSIPKGGARLGGVVLPELYIGGYEIDIGGATLVVSAPDHTLTIGHDNLTGVYQ